MSETGVRLILAFAVLLLAGPAGATQGASITIKTSQGPPGGGAGEACFPVDEIRVSGIELVAPARLHAALAPIARRCLGNGVARALVTAINEMHAEMGYVTTQAYLPEQDIRKSRALAIQLVTGRVDRIVYKERFAGEGLRHAFGRVQAAAQPLEALSGALGVLDALDDPLDRFQLLDGADHPGLKPWLAAPIGPGDVVELDRIQQGLDQINKAPSARASSKLSPGAEPGTSLVEIDNPWEDSFRLFVGYEVNGSSINGYGTTTPERLRLDAAKDNLIGINDAWRLSLAGGLDSNEVNAGLSVPIRWLTFDLSGSYTELDSAIGEAAWLHARTSQAGIGLSYLAWREADLQAVIDAGLRWRHGERFIDTITLQPQTISIGRVGLSATAPWRLAVWSAGLALEQG